MFIDKEIYKTIVEYSIIPTVDIIFLDTDKRVLLWLRNNEPLKWKYHLPGWRIEKNETILQAAQRKAKEELSITIDIQRLQFVWVYDDIFDNSDFGSFSSHFIPITFSYELSTEEESNIITDEQHDDIKFFAYNDPEIHPFLEKRLQDIQAKYHIF